jgi:bla regulator protein blaR1
MARRSAKLLNLQGKICWASISLAGTCALISWGLVSAARVWAQKTDAVPSFEVASIKLNRSPRPLTGVHIFGDRFNATTSALGLIADAYDLHGAQVSGGPDWIKSEVFDIDAKIDDSLVEGPWKKLSIEQQMSQAMLMLRSLLADRFKLTVTHATKELPVYALVLAKDGPKFAEDDSHIKTRLVNAGFGKVEARSIDVGTFVKVLSMMPEIGGRTLVDKTGLHGNYSFTLQWTSEILAAAARQTAHNASESSGPSLFTALQEQLGLKLESTKAPLDTIVIEHIEQPSQN